MRQQQGPHTPSSALFHLLCPCQSSQEREKGHGKREFGIPQTFSTCRLRARPWGFGSPGWLGRLWVRFRHRTHKVEDGNPPCARGTSAQPTENFWVAAHKKCVQARGSPCTEPHCGGTGGGDSPGPSLGCTGLGAGSGSLPGEIPFAAPRWVLEVCGSREPLCCLRLCPSSSPL